MTDQRLSIAIVDDEESVGIALRRLCIACGMDARAYSSAQQLFEAIDQDRPDCLILDVQMPGLSGLDAQAMLADSGIRIPAIMITGRDDEDVRDRCIAVGACACLWKPVDADVLVAAIRHATSPARQSVDRLYPADDNLATV